MLKPLFATVAAQDLAIKGFEEQYKKNAVIDVTKNYGVNTKCSQNTTRAMGECFVNAVKEEENRFQRENIAKKRENEEATQNLKRKPEVPAPVKKLKTSEITENYQETEQEILRKKALEAKLAKKKNSKKLDFL